jgi:spermidine synthase
VTAYKYPESDRFAELLVNGVGMTTPSILTKIMAHLPLALRGDPPKKVLTICFGMGTTYRSLMSWGTDTTAIELTPSVKDLFSYYFSDAEIINKNIKGRIIIDDGRRYLEKSNDTYDLIVIDPPPPIEAAGSSLLYTKEFYEIADKHLSKNGILAQWYPGGDDITLSAVARSLVETFPYVVAYKPFGGSGYHLLASKSVINSITPKQFLDSMPINAKIDLMEWNDYNVTDLEYAKIILSGKTDIKNLLRENKNIIITDDKPFNEYYLLRRNKIISHN